MPHSPTTRALTRGVLGAASVYALTRAAAYAWPRDIQDPLIVASLGGTLIPVYAGLWAVAALFCLWDMRRPTLHGWGMPSVVGLMFLWSAAYAVGQIVAVADHGDWPLWWQTSATYGGPAVWTVLLVSLVAILIRRTLNAEAEARRYRPPTGSTSTVRDTRRERDG